MELGKNIFGPPAPSWALQIKFENFGNYQAFIGNKTYFLKNTFWSLQTIYQWSQMIKYGYIRVGETPDVQKVSKQRKKAQNLPILLDFLGGPWGTPGAIQTPKNSFNLF